MINVRMSELFLTFLFCIIVFTNAYMNFFKMSFEKAAFSSIRIQTLSGSAVQPESQEHKLLISLQSVLAYLITSGLLILSVDFK
jgi:hypothetical protein